MSDTPRIRPVIILPVGEISKKDIKELRANGLCVVEAKDPSRVRFAEPPPLGYSVQEQAAIKLCRWVLSHRSEHYFQRYDLAQKLADFFCEGSPLQPIFPTAQTPVNLPAKKQTP